MKFSDYFLIVFMGIASFVASIVVFLFHGFKLGLIPYQTIVLIALGFFTMSIAIATILRFVAKRNFDQIGMSFLALTSIKLLPAYLLVRVLTHSENSLIITKVGYLTFVLFLIIEVYFTYRLLNNKQKK